MGPILLQLLQIIVLLNDVPIRYIEHIFRAKMKRGLLRIEYLYVGLFSFPATLGYDLVAIKSLN